MTTGYLLSRRLRHLRSLSLYNVAIKLEIEKSVDSKDQPKLLGELVRYLPCYYTIENLDGELIFVSEVQQSSLRQLRFNDVNFQGNPTSTFILKITVQLSSRFFETDDDWCIIATMQIDLNKLQPFDPDNDVIEGFNIPVFNMDDGHYTVLETRLRKSTKSATFLGIAGSNVPSKDKRSFAYSTILRINTLLDYLDQTHEEINTTAQGIETQIQNTLRIGAWFKESIRDSERKLEKSNEQKRTEILQLKNKLSDSTSLLLSGVDAELLPYEPPSNSIKDDYGITFSKLSQTRDYLCYLRFKKLGHLIDIFEGIGILDQCSLKNTSFADSNMEAIKILQVHVESNGTTGGRKQFSFKKLSYPRIVAKLENSDLKVNELNTCLGYLTLLLQTIANSIFKVPLPCKLMYYGSTSIIETLYPLFLPEPYSTQNLLLFRQALQFLNVDILQVQQYLDYQYSLALSPSN